MLALHLERSRCREEPRLGARLHGGTGLRITAMPRPGDGYGLRADALRGSWRERRGGQGRRCPGLRRSPGLGGARGRAARREDPGGRGPLRLPPPKLRPARGASSRPAGDTSGEHPPLARTRPPAPASLRDALLLQRGLRDRVRLGAGLRGAPTRVAHNKDGAHGVHEQDRRGGVGDYCPPSAVAFSCASEVCQRCLMSREAIGAASLPRPLKLTSSSTRSEVPTGEGIRL